MSGRPNDGRHDAPGARLAVTLLAIAAALLPFGHTQAQDGEGARGPGPKVDADLAALASEYAGYLSYTSSGVGDVHGFRPTNPMLPVVGDRVVIDAVASGDAAALRADLEALGLQQAASMGRIVSGQLPIAAIGALAPLDTLRFARPAYSTLSVGLVASQGDAAMRAGVARSTFGVSGAGVTVGVLSDSFNCLGGASADVAGGDLPAGIVVLDDTGCTEGEDEGRAMMQLVHDVAPGAALAFHTADGGTAGFAAGIVALATQAGADVIVDDVIYFAEPMFQDGVVAQAVDIVVGLGVAYFSSAGNFGRNAYESPFRPGLTFAKDALPTNRSFDPDFGAGAPRFFGGLAHDFEPGPGVDVLQRITVPPGTRFSMSLQWDQPFFSVSGGAGSANEVDVYVLDAPGSTVLGGRAGVDIGKDAVEVFGFFNPAGSGLTQFNLMVVQDTSLGGPTPGFLKYVMIDFRGTVDEFATHSGTLFGHANAAGAEAVGAAAYSKTPAFGVSPPLLEAFSSAGPTRILFDASGTPVFEVRNKPRITAPDGGNTTFFGGNDIEPDGFPNFFGTSAAAPNAAAVAALLLEAKPSLSPAAVYGALEGTATDMGPPGYDFDSGFGLVQADLALQAVVPSQQPTPTPTPSATSTPAPTPTPVPGATGWGLAALAIGLAAVFALRKGRAPVRGKGGGPPPAGW